MNTKHGSESLKGREFSEGLGVHGRRILKRDGNILKLDRRNRI
jgi:hypothetical protein